MYKAVASSRLDKTLSKLSKKNPKHFKIIVKKVEEIAKDPHSYKNLKAPLNNLKRVHINKHFVLVFSIDEENKIVLLEKFGHHKTIYNAVICLHQALAAA